MVRWVLVVCRCLLFVVCSVDVFCFVVYCLVFLVYCVLFDIVFFCCCRVLSVVGCCCLFWCGVSVVRCSLFAVYSLLLVEFSVLNCLLCNVCFTLFVG